MMQELLRELDVLRRRLERLEAVEGGALISRATAFPSTPTTGQLVYRSDRSLLYYYDGTRWLTTTEYPLVIPVYNRAVAASAAMSAVDLPATATAAIYVTRAAAGYYVFTTNSAVNYWTIQIRGINDTYTAATTIAETDTSAAAPNTWSHVEMTITTPAPTNRSRIDINAMRTGAAGALECNLTLYYRLIG